MNAQLPTPFVERMKILLASKFEVFLESYHQSARHGLRVNSLKIEPTIFHDSMRPFSLTSVPWCREGFLYPETQRPGKHPYHAAGLYYIQEPSAMAVADVLEVRPGDFVLDLCAAPGGKSTQLAAALRGEGLLIANEIHPTRVKALSENIERLGITNAIVTNETPDRLARRFPTYFDRILVDAPCSGEGMFRKLPEACEDWSLEKVTECQLMQQEILEDAFRMLKPGGTLVYSTCTFAPQENEQSIAWFLANHSECKLVSIPHPEWFAPGRPDWADPTDPSLHLTARLWPHLLEGEGHFIAKLIKQADDDESENTTGSKREKKGKPSSSSAGRKEAIAIWRSFAPDVTPGCAEQFTDDSAFTLFGEQLYYSPAPYLSLDGLKVVRAGLHLGTVKKNRFEPSHALALALTRRDAVRIADFSADDPDLLRYLRGESLAHQGEPGWTLVTVDGYSLGWGKCADGQLKNHYPKGLRWL